VSIVRRSTQEEDFRGRASESHLCVDCGFDTAPGLLDRRAMEEAAKALGDAWTKMDQGIPQHIDQNSEVYRVRDSVWKKAGMTPWGGCLCVGCLEARIGRRLKPKDFDRYHPFNDIPGTKRLLSRRDG
jgi:hypothetical protein